MISFTSFSPEDGVPIYQQILFHIKRGVAAGRVADGDELPSRRVLSALLGVNPNTVQKAYHLLEEEGLIESRSGAKSYMRLDAARIEAVRRELVELSARSAVERFRSMGLSREEALGLIGKYWEEDGE